MRKFWLILALLAALTLTACGQAASTAVPQATQTSQVLPAGEPMECMVFSVFPEPKDPAALKLPPISGSDWSRGLEDAVLTLLVYSDFQCPYCALTGRILTEFENAHPDELRVVYRHFPLNIHDKASLSAQAAEAAGLQGKFWEMHDILVAEENWTVWTSQTPADFEKWVVEQAKSIGLDADRFSKDLTSDAVVKKIADSNQAALDLGLNSTPSLYFFLNGKLIFVPDDQVSYDPAVLQIIIGLENMKDLQYQQCPPTVIDNDKEYTATIKTEKGDIKVNLFADKAPLAVNSFVFLARQGYFDGITFHRVMHDFVAQTGDPSGTGSGNPGYQFANEISEDLTYDRAGLLGMANSGADTNGSQFFITYKELPDLNGGYTIFGEVIEGMDVVKELTERNPATAQSELPPGDKLISITIEEK